MFESQPVTARVEVRNHPAAQLELAGGNAESGRRGRRHRCHPALPMTHGDGTPCFATSARGNRRDGHTSQRIVTTDPWTRHLPDVTYIFRVEMATHVVWDWNGMLCDDLHCCVDRPAGLVTDRLQHPSCCAPST